MTQITKKRLAKRNKGTHLFRTFLSLVSNTSLGLILRLVGLYLVYWVVFLKQITALILNKLKILILVL